MYMLPSFPMRDLQAVEKHSSLYDEKYASPSLHSLNVFRAVSRVSGTPGLWRARALALAGQALGGVRLLRVAAT